MAIVKCNFMLNDEVKEWYKAEAEKIGLSMSGLMSYVLSQYKKNEEMKMVLNDMNKASKDLNLSELSEMVKIISAVEDKRLSGE